jgi:hypothetical protein
MLRWALIEAVQRAGPDTAAGAVKARIIARRGNQTRTPPAPPAAAGLRPVLDPPVRPRGHGNDQGNRRRQSRTPALSQKPVKTPEKTP